MKELYCYNFPSFLAGLLTFNIGPCKPRKSTGIYFITVTISWGKTVTGVKLCKVFRTYPLAFALE